MAIRWTKEHDQFIIKEWFDNVKPSLIARHVEDRFGFRCTGSMVVGRIYRLRSGAVSAPPRKPAVVSVRRDLDPYRTNWQRLVVPGDVTMPRVEWNGRLL